MNRAIVLLLCFGLIGLVACEKQKTEEQKGEEKTVESTETTIQTTEKPETMANLKPPAPEDIGDPDEVAVLTTEKGEIVLEFFPDDAPLHVANFKNLAKAGFYDGTTFHRVIPGFMIQGGDPNSKDDDPMNDGQGGPGYSVQAEFNKRHHEPGILSMARSTDPNSAGSQFFICLGTPTNLDGKYTVFGRTIKGMDVVKAIGKTRREPPRDAQKPAVKMKSVKIVKRSEIKL